jgi:methionyl-tRNA formyltransferase
MDALRLVAPDEKLRVIALACGALGVRLIQGLLDCPDVADIIAFMPVTNVKGYGNLTDQGVETELRQLVETSQIEFLDTVSVNSKEFLDVLDQLKPHVVLLGEWPEIIGPAVVGHEDLIIVNSHGSLLPEFRGANPYLATIFYGAKETGYTFHLVDTGIDTGDILFQEALEVEEGETALNLYVRSAERMGQTIGKLFSDLVAGTLVPQQQKGKGSYVPAVRPEWGWIQWQLDPFILGRRIRAIFGYVPLRTTINECVVGFKNGYLIPSRSQPSPAAQSQAAPNNAEVIEAGVVVANKSPDFVMTTLDPDWYVELTDAFVFGMTSPQSDEFIRSVQPGDQCESVAFDHVIKAESE